MTAVPIQETGRRIADKCPNKPRTMKPETSLRKRRAA